MAYIFVYAIFLFTVAAYRDSCRLFLREDVLIDLDGVEFAVGEVVVLLFFEISKDSARFVVSGSKKRRLNSSKIYQK